MYWEDQVQSKTANNRKRPSVTYQSYEFHELLKQDAEREERNVHRATKRPLSETVLEGPKIAQRFGLATSLQVAGWAISISSGVS